MAESSQSGAAVADKHNKKGGKGNKPKSVAEQAEGRPVLYPKFESNEMVGDNAFSVAKTDKFPQDFGMVGELLGITYDEAYAKQHGCEQPLFIDRNKKPVYALNNPSNRPVNFGKVEDLVQEIKFSGTARQPEQRRWQFNSEPIIIGKTGLVLNGQKQMIAMLLAEQDRTGPQAMTWEYLGWDRPIQLDKVVNTGVDENEIVVDTIDTAQPRSLSDVIYRSEHFSKFKPEARKAVSRMADYAIRMLWDRTGAGYKPKKGGPGTTAPRRTTPESMDFLRRHPRLLEAIKHVYEEYGKDEKLKTNRELMSPGYASALLYLMGTSATDGERNGLGQLIDYADAEPAPNESVLNFDYFDGAKEFWMCLARMPVDGDVVCPNFREILNAIAAIEPPSGSARVSLSDRIAVISLAWGHFVVGSEFKRAEITPEWSYAEKTGAKKLKEPYAIGGLDLGHAPDMEAEPESAAVEKTEESSVPDIDDPSPEQVEAINAQKARIDADRVKEVQQKLREAAARRSAAAQRGPATGS